jgi:hypothetical protein
MADYSPEALLLQHAKSIVTEMQFLLFIKCYQELLYKKKGERKEDWVVMEEIKSGISSISSGQNFRVDMECRRIWSNLFHTPMPEIKKVKHVPSTGFEHIIEQFVYKQIVCHRKALALDEKLNLVRRHLSRQLNELLFGKNGRKWEGPPPEIVGYTEIEMTFYEKGILALTDDYLRGVSRIFKIASAFGKHLHEWDSAESLAIPVSILYQAATRSEKESDHLTPNGSYYWFELPSSIKFTRHDGETTLYAQSVLVTVSLLFDQILIAGAIIEHVGGGTRFVARCGMTYGKDVLFSEAITQQELTPFYPELWSFILKCLVYIESGDPNLTYDYAPKNTLLPRPPKAQEEPENLSSIDLIKVGYSFHGRNYKEGSWPVKGHFKWQPYGPQRSKYKLIWVDEQRRSRQKGKTKPCSYRASL